MQKKSLRDFPTEDRYGPWPLLKTTKGDLSYMPTPKPSQTPRSKQPQQVGTKAPLQVLFLDFASAVLKGAILGLFVFALIYSFLPLHAFWLSSWHWVYLIGGIILLIIFVGLNISFVALLVISTVAALWLNWNMIVTYPIIPLLFIGGGVVVLCIRELLPQKTP